MGTCQKARSASSRSVCRDEPLSKMEAHRAQGEGLVDTLTMAKMTANHGISNRQLAASSDSFVLLIEFNYDGEYRFSIITKTSKSNVDKV